MKDYHYLTTKATLLKAIKEMAMWFVSRIVQNFFFQFNASLDREIATKDGYISFSNMLY
jgi:hypothetical protein